jgi:hypothetical protein
VSVYALKNAWGPRHPAISVSGNERFAEEATADGRSLASPDAVERAGVCERARSIVKTCPPLVQPRSNRPQQTTNVKGGSTLYCSCLWVEFGSLGISQLTFEIMYRYLVVTL